MEDPIVATEVAHPLSPCDDEPPECKKRKVETDEKEAESPKSESVPSERDENFSNDVQGKNSDPNINTNSPQLPLISSSDEKEEPRAPSPIPVVSIGFDSIIDDDEEDSEVLVTTQNDEGLGLSEDEDEGKMIESDSSDEIEVIKEETKTETRKNRRKTVNQRRNIKEVIGQDHLDERTLAAQKEEWMRRERIAAKQMSLGKNISRMPLSMEQIMERFSSASSMVSVTPVCGPESTTKTSSVTPKSSDEQEVLILSSDDEDCVPCFDSTTSYNYENTPSTSQYYDSYDSHSSRSRYSGGTMLVNNRDRSEATFGDELEEIQEKVEEEEEDDDDCVVLSPPPPDAIDEEKDEDAFNVLDEQGRVLVNFGHPPEEPDIFLAPQIARAVKPHQIGGIRFMYDNIVESLERYNNSAGFGCILAHSMGLGKTIQAAAFCDIFLNHTGANTVLVIVPINTIQNWLNEFNHWLPPSKPSGCSTISTPTSTSTPQKKRGRKVKSEQETNTLQTERTDETLSPENSHSSEEDGDEDLKPKTEDSQYRTFEIFVLNETVKNLAGRGKIISDWSERRGVLLIGYEMYRMLALKRLRRSGKKKKPFDDLLDDKTVSKAAEEEAILDKIYSCLVKPGPDLVICDEGHRIKNSGASISQALKAIKTKRRVVLTGYPLQNNLMEYHCMCDFIRPNYLGTKAEFSNMFERPIINGQCVDSTMSDKRLMQFRSHVLHSLLEGFVQRRSHLVLQRALPRKEEWVFLVKMTPIQTLLYEEFITHVRQTAEIGNTTPNPIKAFAICCKIWNHPDVLYNVIAKKDKDKEKAMLEDLEDLAEEVEGLKWKKGQIKTKGDSPNSKVNNGLSLPEDDECTLSFGKWNEGGCNSNQSEWSNMRESSNGGTSRIRENDPGVTLEWSLNALKDYVPNVLENGTKFELLFLIIHETVNIGDKLLVFSQSLFTLNLMEMFLGMKRQWMKGKDYFRLDGSTTGLERERLIKEFNKNPDIHVFLVSTRAGSLGINLIGANRVVVFDASWNPCHDCQAVCRVYRYGQKKRCQIYRFVTDCTLEKKIYDRQITKRGMANRVVDEMNPDAHFSTKDLSGSLLLELDDLMNLQSVRINHDLSPFDDPVIHHLLRNGGDKITKAPFEHESLLIDRKEKKLSKAERRLALRNYEMEKKAIINQGLTPTGRQSHYKAEYSHGFPPPNHPSGYPPNGNFGMRNPYRNNFVYNTHGFGSSASYLPPTEFADKTNGLPVSLEELRRKGISVQGIVLKKDSFLADPDGGPDIYLMAGQKVYLFRSSRGTYLRLSNGRFIAVRKRARGQAQNVLDSVPPSQDLTKEQVFIVINSILRPKITEILPKPPPDFQTSGRYFPPPSSSSSYNYPSMPVPIPSSYNNYGSYPINQQHNLQITNQRNSSGGDVTIWKKDHSLRKSSTSGTKDLIPDIEVIKINPEGEDERIEPTQLESELLKHRQQQIFNSFPSYLGKSISSTTNYTQSSNNLNVSSILQGIERGQEDMGLKLRNPFCDAPVVSTSSSDRRHSLYGDSHQSPLEKLRNSVAQMPKPNFKLSEDVVIDYLDNSSSSNSNPFPESLTKLMKSQQHSTLSSLPTQFDQTMRTQEANLTQLLSQASNTSSNNSGIFFGGPSVYNAKPNSSIGNSSSHSNSGHTNSGHSNSGHTNSGHQYYTNGGSMRVNEKPSKAIFTPAELEILDRHRKELL